MHAGVSIHEFDLVGDARSSGDDRRFQDELRQHDVTNSEQLNASITILHCGPNYLNLSNEEGLGLTRRSLSVVGQQMWEVLPRDDF